MHAGIKHSPFYQYVLCVAAGSVVYVGGCALVVSNLPLSYRLVLAGVTLVRACV